MPMKRWFYVLILLLMASMAGAQTLSYDGVCQDAVIDVRTPQEYAEGHVDGAVNIPLEQLDSGMESLRSLRKDSRIMVYCRTGRRSAEAHEWLKRKGFRQVLDGGAYESLKPKMQPCATR